MRNHPSLVVFSHLRWDFVWQRPQHLLTRLARERRVLFIEEPVHDAQGGLTWEHQAPVAGLTVCCPRTPSSASGFHEEQMPYLLELMKQLPERDSLRRCQTWFYTPMALPLVETLDHGAIIYDCMDELSGFRGAPRQLLEREAELLRRADIVFTGGPSLFRAKKDRHPNVHCFPSSVDLAHFSKARERQADHPRQADLPHPRLGYFGVLDERLDLELLRELAQARPEWQLILVGPVVKIDPRELPQLPNIHYFGQQPYDVLPSFLAGWDVCLLPFAHNDATRFISPTKTLEYMAADKPIVSTSIADVAGPYAEIVYLADTPEAFLAACERALLSSPEERAIRIERKRAILAQTSWDSTAQKMSGLLDQMAARDTASEVASVPDTREGTTTASPVVVIGAGPTGLSAAYHLGEKALLLEQNNRVGGWCRSIQDNGFTFDFAGHIMFSNDPYVQELYQLLLGDNVHWQNREAWVYSKGVYTRYPFQGALYGLPPEVIKECILGAIEARFGPLKETGGNAALVQKLSGSNGTAPKLNGKSNSDNGTKSASVRDCCADGVLESTARLGHRNGNGASSNVPSSSRGSGNFEEFIYQVWGAGIAKHFAVPYNRKLWAVPLDEMETSWLGGRVPIPDLAEMIEGALKPVPRPMGPNARFGYPLQGGFQALMDGFLPHLRGPLRLGSRVAAVSPTNHRLTLQDGSEIAYQHLISTMPLPVLIRCMGEEAPAEVRNAAAGLRYVSVRCVHLGIGRDNVSEKHWIYYPEDTIFHRIFVQGNASPYCNKPGGFGLTCEITYHPHYKPLPCDQDALIERCLEDCYKVGFLKRSDPIWAATQVDLPHAYVIYDHARPGNVALIRDWLASKDITLAGRYSEWEYYNSDHAFLAGKKAADKVRASLKSANTAPVAVAT